jgi:putative peptidoglycan lipid II flippase
MAESTADAVRHDQLTQRPGSRLISATVLMASGTALSRVLGFIKAALIVAALGAGTRQADMFGTAQVIPQAVYMLLAGGVLNTVFVPQIVRAMETHADGGESYTNRLITLAMSAIGLITIGATALAPVLIGDVYLSGKWKAPELAGQYHSVIMLSYLCLPQIFFYGIHVMVGQVLNARGKFGPMMWSPIGNNIIAIASILLFLAVWHGHTDTGAPFTTGQILVLGLGATLGIAAQGLLLIPFLHGVGFRFRPRFDFRHSGLGRAAHVAKWTVGYMIVTQLGLVVITRLANGATAGGHGAGWTVYQYAQLIFMLPHSLITVSLVTAMLPSISRSVVAGDLDAARREVTQTMRLTLTALLPAAVAFIALGFPIAAVLFGHGAGAGQWRPIGWTLMAFAIGLVPFTLQHVCLRAFYALENTRITFVIQILIVAVNVGAALGFVLALATPLWVAPALALAYAAAYVIGLGASLRQLSKHLPGFSVSELAGHGLRVFLAVLPAGALGYLIAIVFGWWSAGTWARLLALVAAAVAAVPVYVGMARLLRIAEINEILAMVARRIGRGGGSAGGQSPPSGGSVPPGGDASGNIATEMAVETGAADVADAGTADETSAVTQIRLQHLDFAAEPQQMTDKQAQQSLRDTSDTQSLRDTEPGGYASIQDDEDRAADTAGDESGQDEDTQAYNFAELTADDQVRRRREPAGSVSGWVAETATPTDSPTGTDEPDGSDSDYLPAGTVLGGRYRLEELLATATASVAWRAFDQVLSRSVLVHLLPAGDQRSSSLLAAGRHAAGATDSRFLRVLDAVEEDGRDAAGRPIGCYVVCEYAAGETLRDVLSVAPLTGLEAAWVIREVADAMAGVHRRGSHHGRLDPDAVIITPTGNIEIVGLLIEEALAQHNEATDASTADPPTGNDADPVDGQQDDISSLGRLLYACLVARWPGGPAFEMPAAPTSGFHDGPHWLTPRQVRHGVSPTLDRICDQLLSPVPRQQSSPITDAAGLVNALDRVLGSADATGDLERRLRHPQPAFATEAGEQPIPQPAQRPTATSDAETELIPTGHGAVVADTTAADETTNIRPVPPASAPASAAPGTRRRRRRWRWIPPVIIAVLLAALVSVLVVRELGSSRHQAGSSSTSGSKTVKIVRAHDFDPQGNKSENPNEVKYALDGNPKTRWRTLAYYNSPKFGHLKDGLGLVLDLGRPHRAGEVDLRLSGHGTGVEARVPKGDAATVSSPNMDSASAWRTVARRRDAGARATLKFDQPVKTRFVLVYLTSLPKEGGNYRGGIYTVTVRS